MQPITVESNARRWEINKLWKEKLRSFLIILLFPIPLIVQYAYGVDDQAIVVPFLKEFVNDKLYQNDYLLTQKPYYYGYLWDFIGLVNKIGFSIEIISFLIYLLSVLFTFLGVYVISLELFQRKEVAYISLFILLFGKVTVGDAVTVENLLLARVMALPMLIFALYFFLREEYFYSFLLQGISFNIHPRNAIYVFLITIITFVLLHRQLGFKRFVLYSLSFLFGSIPTIIWIITNHASNPFFPSPNWMEILRIRSSHHIFPLSWSYWRLLEPTLVLFVLFISYKRGPQSKHQKTIILFTVAILFICLMGVIFSEFVPISFILILQPLRSFLFLEYFMIIYFASYFFSAINKNGGIVEKFWLILFLQVCCTVRHICCMG